MANMSQEVKQAVNWLEQILTEKLFEDHHESNEFVPFLEAFYTLNECYGSNAPLISEFKKVANEIKRLSGESSGVAQACRDNILFDSMT